MSVFPFDDPREGYDDSCRELNDESYTETDGFALKIRELINGEVKATINETVNRLQRVNKRNTRLSKENNVLMFEARDHERKVQEERKQAVEEFSRSLFNGFKPGDKVILAHGTYSSTPCVICEGGRKVTAHFSGAEIKVQCPTCNGSGGKGGYTYAPFHDSIGSMSVTLSDRYKHSVSIYLNRKHDSKVTDEVVFDTIEACQAYCDEKNKEAEGTN